LRRPSGPRRKAGSPRGSLVVVGTGLKAAAQSTLEAVALMRRADKLYYLVTDPVTEFWVRHLNPTAETLSDLYGETIPRQRTYRAMTARITAAVRSGLNVCAAFYGHPGVFVETSHQAIDALRRQQYPARMLPAVSADACLYADLGVDPGICGAQSFEATDFLLFRRRFDPTSILLLWQLGVLGVATASNAPCRPERLSTLTQRLRRHYPARHPVVLYRAGQRPGEAPSIRPLELRELPHHDIYALDTLYVPPLRQRRPDVAIEKWYDQPPLGIVRAPSALRVRRRSRASLGTSNKVRV
jgi:precorrin-3B methylase